MSMFKTDVLKTTMSQEPQRYNQYVCTAGIALASFACGNAIGWSSSADEILVEHYNYTQRDNKLVQISSALKLGAAVAEGTIGLTIDYIGEKSIMIGASIPFLIGWLLLAFSHTRTKLCFGRFLLGYSVGCYCISAPNYIGEIADRKIRGTLLECFSLAMVTGILAVYILGEFDNMYAITLPFAVCPVVLVIILSFMPSPPAYLYLCKETEKARRALQFFRGPDYDVTEELKQIADQLMDFRNTFWSQLMTHSSFKAGVLLIVMHSIQQLTGMYAIIFHATNICKMTHYFEHSNYGAILLGVIQLLFSIVASATVDSVGRRALWIISLAVMAVSHIVIGSSFLNIDAHSLRAVVGLSFLIASYSVGAGPVPFIMMAELVPIQVKGLIGSIAMVFHWLVGYGVVLAFQPIVDSQGEPCIFYIYAAFCFIGILFGIFFFIETKHKTIKEIQDLLETGFWLTHST